MLFRHLLPGVQESSLEITVYPPQLKKMAISLKAIMNIVSLLTLHQAVRMVFIPKHIDEPLKGFSKWEDLFNAAWASLYDNYEDALANNG